MSIRFSSTVNNPVPSKWPFSAGRRPAKPAQHPARQPSGPAGSAHATRAGGLTRGAMVADVLLVMVWGATIPGLLWLGTLGGF
jgi:hypothetical protein